MPPASPVELPHRSREPFTVRQLEIAIWVATITSSLSLVCSLAIVVSIYYRRAAFRARFPIISSLLFYMSLCDCFFTLILCVEYIPVVNHFVHHSLETMKPTFSTRASCSIAATLFQFSQLSSFGWYAVTAMFSFRLIRSLDLMTWTAPERNEKAEHAFVWTTALILSLLPLIGDHYSWDIDSHYTECWIGQLRDMYRLTFYIPLCCTLLLAWSLLAYTAVVVCRNRLTLTVPGTKRRLLRRLSMFVAVFCFCWIAPLVDRMYEMAYNKVAPFWMQVGHAGTGPLFGTLNAVLFFGSPGFRKLVLHGRKRSEATSLIHPREGDTSMVSGAASQYSESSCWTSDMLTDDYDSGF